LAEYRPDPQAAHVDIPASDAKSPAAHSLQLLEPSPEAALPAAQLWHTDALAPENFPAAHAPHVESPLIENVPLTHGLQTPAPLGENSPLAQNRHVDSLVKE